MPSTQSPPSDVDTMTVWLQFRCARPLRRVASCRTQTIACAQSGSLVQPQRRRPCLSLMWSVGSNRVGPNVPANPSLLAFQSTVLHACNKNYGQYLKYNTLSWQSEYPSEMWDGMPPVRLLCIICKSVSALSEPQVGHQIN